MDRKILIFSDSHGYSKYMHKALEMHSDAEMIIHLGDGSRDLSILFPEHTTAPLLFIEGNGESGGWVQIDRKHPPIENGFVKFDGKKIFATHGHKYNVKSGLSNLISQGYEKGADIILFGHTHQAFSQYIPAGTNLGLMGKTDRPLIIFNPGSIGSGPNYSFGLLSFSNGEVLPSHGRF